MRLEGVRKGCRTLHFINPFGFCTDPATPEFRKLSRGPNPAAGHGLRVKFFQHFQKFFQRGQLSGPKAHSCSPLVCVPHCYAKARAVPRTWANGWAHTAHANFMILVQYLPRAPAGFFGAVWRFGPSPLRPVPGTSRKPEPVGRRRHKNSLGPGPMR